MSDDMKAVLNITSILFLSYILFSHSLEIIKLRDEVKQLKQQSQVILNHEEGK